LDRTTGEGEENLVTLSSFAFNNNTIIGGLMNNFSASQLDRRAAAILRGIQSRQVSPDSDAMAELGELTEAIADQPVKPVVVARLTITRQNGWRTIVEVHSDATFATFYRFFRQFEGKRSSKEQIRAAHRNEGVQLSVFAQAAQKPGLELIAQRLEACGAPSNPVVKKTLRIIKRRAYRKLINARPDELGLTKTAPFKLRHPFARHS
jgi:hypothetical protein